jgi:putative tryptophan/tyrosine transport system substrate-binding protein
MSAPIRSAHTERRHAVRRREVTSLWLRIVGCLVTLALGLPSALLVAEAQPPAKKVYRMGVLGAASPSPVDPRHEAFLQGLHELGYVEGKNLLIEYRYAEGKFERLPDLAADLVRLNVDVIVVAGTRITAAAKQATSTIPIVVQSAGDLVGAGLVASLAKPGGNITGSTDISPDTSGKRLAFLREAVPQASHVAVLWSRSPGDLDELRETETAAVQLGVTIQPVEVHDPQEFPSAYAAMTQRHAQAVIMTLSAFTSFHRRQLLELAVQHRWPSMCEPVEWTRDGCLMSYGPDLVVLWRRAATYVDKILKGAKPADLPVEQPTTFKLAINLKTAQALGITIPPTLLFQAEEVIR